MNKLTFKPFAVHYNIPHTRYDTAKVRSRPRGFTCWISPCPVPGHIYIQTTLCAYRDNFCRKEGVKEAKKTVIKQINARHLNKKLCELVDSIEGFSMQHSYEYLWKYLL